MATYPAAAIVVIEGSLPADFKKSGVAPNLLLAHSLETGPGASPAPWAELVVVPADRSDLLQIAVALDLPVMVRRDLKTPAELPAARAACDALQRDLAAVGQFAAYIV